MASTSIYRDIAKRTGGDIYIGVVGPVRTGKSTFIKRFMETSVIPSIASAEARERATDELPQSGSGRTVMTTEPKFVPEEAVRITVGGDTALSVRMIDCVGYGVEGALGDLEDGAPRMVHTPWSEEAMPFAEAAEMGTERVIRDHSTIGILVTTDGTIGELPRTAYLPAEERVASELSALGKPFAIVLNSRHPGSEEAISLAYELEKKYRAPVALVNCTELNGDDISHILELVLGAFPVTELTFRLPPWCAALPCDHPLRKALRAYVDGRCAAITRYGDIRAALSEGADGPVASATPCEMRAGDGSAEIALALDEGLYLSTLSELSGREIASEGELFRLFCRLSEDARAYEKVADALREANEAGYGIVLPSLSDLRLEEPEIVKQSGGYGVKLKASAPSIHMIRADIETELSPIVGTEQQSEELCRYLLHEFEEDPQGIWSSNMFGKPLYELVNEGLHQKLSHMPASARQRLGETLGRIINEGSSGLVCILL
ncbi:MAG: stage IV sporulation protein A [Clostridia bacterium]|nr:stage IV sporulation protein A [Clostridia bacterium]